MSNAEWEEEVAREKAFLDGIDIKAMLVFGADIGDVMWDIEDEYRDQYDEDFVFNCMDEEDFVKYLNQRYPEIKLYPQEITTYRVISNN